MKTFRQFHEDGVATGGAMATTTTSGGQSPIEKQIKKKAPASLGARQGRVREVMPEETQIDEMGGDQHYSDTKGATSGGGNATPITRKKMVDDAAKTLRRVTDTANMAPAPARTFMTKEEAELDESRGSDYALYHKSYTDAINHALGHHGKSGLTVSDDDRFHHVGVMSKKPSEGNTTSVNLPATHATTGKKHTIHIQVYNKGGSHPYELNTYSSGVGRHNQNEEVDLDEDTLAAQKEIVKANATTKGVSGAGDNPDKTVPVSKRLQRKIVSRNTRQGGTTAPLVSRAKAVREAREEVQSPRKIGTVVGFKQFERGTKGGGQPVPPESFMTKEEVEQIDELSRLMIINKLLRPINKLSPEEQKKHERARAEAAAKLIGLSVKIPATEEAEIEEMAGANMDRRALVSHIKKQGWQQRSSGASGDHDVFEHPKSTHKIVVPRHNKLKAPLTLSVLKKSKIMDREMAEDTQRAQKEIVAANAKTEKNPTGFATQSPEPDLIDLENDLVKLTKKRK